MLPCNNEGRKLPYGLLINLEENPSCKLHFSLRTLWLNNANPMTLSKLFIIHSLITLGAGIVLIVTPQLIPGTVDIHLEKNSYLICYLLGATEIALAFLSYFAKNISDLNALRLISLTFIVCHAVTAIVEVYAFLQGLSASVWANVALRLVVIFLFWYYGLHKNKASKKESVKSR